MTQAPHSQDQKGPAGQDDALGSETDRSAFSEPITESAIGKIDAQSLELRVPPARTIRFKRGAVITSALMVCGGLVLASWAALRPSASPPVGDPPLPLARPAIDSLSQLPGSYSDVPKLGPPLPGDLGRPILAHERSLELAGQSTGERPARSVQAIDDGAAGESLAARQAGIMAQIRSDPDRTASSPADMGATAASQTVSQNVSQPIDPERDANAQRRKIDFIAHSDTSDGRNPSGLSAAASSDMLLAGSIIPASLMTGLRSDLPGFVIAQVTEHVYDSVSGQHLLIPQGARLIGRYDSVVAYGQRRALIVWQRIILPDGRALTLDNEPATDAAGYSGLADQVDFHSWSLLKGVAISTLLGVSANLALSGENDLLQAIRQSSQTTVSRAGDQLTSQNLAVQPTITIRPGAPVRLIVHHDLQFAM